MSPPPLRSGMARDRSLDEFASGDSGASTGSDADTEAADDSADRESDAEGAETTAESGDADDVARPTTSGDTDTVEPAAVTYRWDPDGVRCPDCGSTVDQLWSGESGQVCADCKEW